MGDARNQCPQCGHLVGLKQLLPMQTGLVFGFFLLCDISGCNKDPSSFLTLLQGSEGRLYGDLGSALCQKMRAIKGLSRIIS